MVLKYSDTNWNTEKFWLKIVKTSMFSRLLFLQTLENPTIATIYQAQNETFKWS